MQADVIIVMEQDRLFSQLSADLKVSLAYVQITAAMCDLLISHTPPSCFAVD